MSICRQSVRLRTIMPRNLHSRIAVKRCLRPVPRPDTPGRSAACRRQAAFQGLPGRPRRPDAPHRAGPGTREPVLCREVVVYVAEEFLHLSRDRRSGVEQFRGIDREVESFVVELDRSRPPCSFSSIRSSVGVLQVEAERDRVDMYLRARRATVPAGSPRPPFRQCSRSATLAELRRSPVMLARGSSARPAAAGLAEVAVRSPARRSRMMRSSRMMTLSPAGWCIRAPWLWRCRSRNGL